MKASKKVLVPMACWAVFFSPISAAALRLGRVECSMLGSEISTSTSRSKLSSLFPLTTAWHTSSQMPTLLLASTELFSMTVPQSM